MADGYFSKIIGHGTPHLPANFRVLSGSHFMLKVTVVDETGEPTPLRLPEVGVGLDGRLLGAVWTLARDSRSAPLLTKTIDQGITIITEEAAEGEANCGRLNVLITADDTADLRGEYFHNCHLIEGTGQGEEGWTGRIFYGRAWFEPALISAPPQA